MRAVTFTKAVAAGNDFVIVDGTALRLGTPALARLARRLCDRRYGVGADGLLVVGRPAGADRAMRIFNPDGSEAEMCGNGIRCVALWGVRRHGARSGRLAIATKAGRLTTAVAGDIVAVRLGERYRVIAEEPVRLTVGGRRFVVHPVHSGVPHAVIFTRRLARASVAEWGAMIRWHRRFAPAGTNVDFVQRLGPRTIRQRTYERGVEAETMACGTGAIASAVALVRQAGRRAGAGRYLIAVLTRSGERLTVAFRLEGTAAREVELRGTARIVYEGRLTDV